MTLQFLCRSGQVTLHLKTTGGHRIVPIFDLTSPSFHFISLIDLSLLEECGLDLNSLIIRTHQAEFCQH